MRSRKSLTLNGGRCSALRDSVLLLLCFGSGFVELGDAVAFRPRGAGVVGGLDAGDTYGSPLLLLLSAFLYAVVHHLAAFLFHAALFVARPAWALLFGCHFFFPPLFLGLGFFAP